MIWNNEFLNGSLSVFDGIFQAGDPELSDIIFQEDLLQELKTCNVDLTQYLLKPEIQAQLIDNITQLTEADCYDKSLHSKVHAAYISCEILTSCHSQMTRALLDSPNSLDKILSYSNAAKGTAEEDENDDSSKENEKEKVPLDKIRFVPQKATLISKLISNIHSQAPADLSCHITKNIEAFSDLIQVLINNIDVSGSFEILNTFINRTTPPELRYVFCEILSKLNFVFSLINVMTLSNVEDKQRNACQLLCDIIVIGRQEIPEPTYRRDQSNPIVQDMLYELIVSRETVRLMLKQMFSYKAQGDPAQSNKQPKEENSTEKDDNRNHHPDYEDQASAANESEASESSQEAAAAVAPSPEPAAAPKAAVAPAAEATPNTTAIICGIKVLQTLVEHKTSYMGPHGGKDVFISHLVGLTGKQIEEEIAENLINFHELLIDPPKQEPIKTTFGVIQKPLGFIRLEVVNLIRALFDIYSPVIIKKLIELRTIKIIIDLFVDYSWNNLLHTQVEQTITNIIKDARSDEELKYDQEMERHGTNHITEESTNQLTLQQNLEREQQEKQQQEEQRQQQEQEQEQQPPLQQNGTSGVTEADETKTTDDGKHENVQGVGDVATIANATTSAGASTTTAAIATTTATTSSTSASNHSSPDESKAEACASSVLSPARPTDGPNIATDTTSNEKTSTSTDESPSIALLSQLLNECDLIGRLLMPKECGKQANFGHIVQIINSIAISRDLDAIKAHLNEMKEKRPDLYARWTTFVNVDVASFKEISLYYGVQSVNNADNNYEYLQKQNQLIQSLGSDQHGYYMNSSSPNHHNSGSPRSQMSPMSNSNVENNAKSMNGNGGDDQITAYFSYFSFTKETVIPSINVDVLPKSRGSTTNKNTNY